MFNFGIFNRSRNVYGSIGPVMFITRIVILITALILVGMLAPDIAKPGTDKKYDPVELFGLILGSITALHTLFGLLPGTKITPVQRLFEAGVVLTVLHLVFLISMRLTPGEMPANYVVAGNTRDGRVWSAFIAAIISAVFLFFTTTVDFLRRHGPPEAKSSREAS